VAEAKLPSSGSPCRDSESSLGEWLLAAEEAAATGLDNLPAEAARESRPAEARAAYLEEEGVAVGDRLAGARKSDHGEPGGSSFGERETGCWDGIDAICCQGRDYDSGCKICLDRGCGPCYGSASALCEVV
jgi:hypothetical protein